MMSEPLYNPTPFADVNGVLGDFEARTRAILGNNFFGMYLSGSLALGDFDPRSSDIDFIVVTDTALFEGAVEELKNIHASFEAGGSPWAGNVEAVYIPRDALRSYPPPTALYPQVEKDRGFFLDHLEIGWVFQCYTLREHGVVLAGPAPRTLIPPVDPDDMRRAAAPIAELWLEQARNDPTWLEWVRPRGHQTFVVLTLCRLLYTLDTGGVASKPGAARWAKQAVEARWAGLIVRSLAGRLESGDAADGEVNDTVAMVRSTVDRFEKWKSNHGQA